MKKQMKAALFAAATAVGLNAPAKADTTVIDTGMPSGTFYALSATQNIGAQFTTNVNQITFVGGYFGNETPGARTISASLYADDSNAIDLGHLLYSTSFDVARHPFDLQFGSADNLAWNVTTGDKYWVVFGTTDVSNLMYMPGGVANPASAYVTVNGNAAVEQQGLNTSLVVRGTDVTAPVPEAGEWAMMAAGLGVVGAAARRRKAATRTAAL